MPKMIKLTWDSQSAYIRHDRIDAARVTVSGVEVSVRYYGRAWSESGWMAMSTGADDGYMRPTHGTTPEEAIEAAIGGTNG